MHWIRSTQKAEQDAESRAKRIERALEELRGLQTKLNTYHLKQRKSIAQRIDSNLEAQRCEQLIKYQIHTTRQYKRKYQGKGRPTEDSPSKVTWKPIYSISFGVDKDSENEEARADGVFPLITNLDTETYSAKKVLDVYKFQPFIEKRFSQLKTYQEIAPVYPNKAERVVAFLHKWPTISRPNNDMPAKIQN